MEKKYTIKEYRNYPEYKLIDLIPYEVTYKRGNEYNEMIFNEYELWQDYFCTDYLPPEEIDTVLFHTCSWSKPYDFSYIIHPIRQVCKKFRNVHRVIVSNVGVVPYEYQMNPSFCAYDFSPIYDLNGKSEEKISLELKNRVNLYYSRIFRYLSKHKSYYKKVVILYPVIANTISHIIILVCKELAIPYEVVISNTLFQSLKNKNYKDSIEEMFIEPEVLIQLERILSME